MTKRDFLLQTIDWKISPSPVDYPTAIAFMESRVQQISEKKASEMVWLLEHPPIYTAGTSARKEDLLHPRFPVYDTGRGGQYTYHGPGQKVAYIMLDLKTRKPDLRWYVWSLEEWLILTLAELGIKAQRSKGRVGLWVQADRNGNSGREDKIAAIGVRIRKWVTFHGISLNVCPDLTHFDGIVPCGIHEAGVTSLAKLGIDLDEDDLNACLQKNFDRVFHENRT